MCTLHFNLKSYLAVFDRMTKGKWCADVSLVLQFIQWLIMLSEEGYALHFSLRLILFEFQGKKNVIIELYNTMLIVVTMSFPLFQLSKVSNYDP